MLKSKPIIKKDSWCITSLEGAHDGKSIGYREMSIHESANDNLVICVKEKVDSCTYKYTHMDLDKTWLKVLKKALEKIK